MKANKFTIIIPTKDRVETLPYSIKTCLAQDYENLEILVSDNFSKDNTKEVVYSFNDPRIRYINTGQPLSMSHNWEFALNHVSEGFVCFMGDDDGFLINSISQVNEILNDTGCRAISWPADYYVWPSCVDNPRVNYLRVTLDTGFKVIDCIEQKKKLLKCEIGYGALPWLYKGFAHIDAINQVKKITGEFFHSMIPDVYSGIALVNVIDNFVFSDKPYAICASSAKSNSGNYKNDDPSVQEKVAFLKENNIPYHEKLLLCLSGYIMQLESIYQAMDAGILDVDVKDVDMFLFIEKAIVEVKNASKQRYGSQLEILRKIVEKNNLDRNKFEEIVKKYPNKAFNERYNYNVNGYNIFKNRIEFDASSQGVRDIFAACELHHDVLANPEKYFTIPAKITSTAKFFYREVMKRF